MGSELPNEDAVTVVGEPLDARPNRVMRATDAHFGDAIGDVHRLCPGTFRTQYPISSLGEHWTEVPMVKPCVMPVALVL